MGRSRKIDNFVDFNKLEAKSSILLIIPQEKVTTSFCDSKILQLKNQADYYASKPLPSLLCSRQEASFPYSQFLSHEFVYKK
jgi:hypothetical protein